MQDDADQFDFDLSDVPRPVFLRRIADEFSALIRQRDSLVRQLEQMQDNSAQLLEVRKKLNARPDESVISALQRVLAERPY